MNLFILSDGVYLNLDHVSKIPSREIISEAMRNNVWVQIRTVNSTESIDPKDAWEIVAHLYSGKELSPKPKTEREWKIGDFVQVRDGRIGIVTRIEGSGGGVYRNHCIVWFGRTGAECAPISEHLLITPSWQHVPKR